MGWMTDREALLQAAALLANYRPLLGERAAYAAVRAHTRPLVVELNRELGLVKA
jgi:hypothetical protein